MKFSIVTPSFRASDWLKLCIASVADQKGVMVEQIVQDSCSDDGTIDWLTSDTRLKVFVEKDAGMYDAINRGLRRAAGDICGYLNCDEQYLPGALKTVADFFTANSDVDVLFGDVVLVDKQGNPLSYRRTVLPTKQHVRFSHLNTTTCATFFRRRLLDQGFYFDTNWKTIGDAVWVEKLLDHGVKMATIPVPLAIFTFTGKNLGASALSEEEVLRWKGSSLARKKFTRLCVVISHRIRKALAGAYRWRHVEIDLYTHESPNKRQHFAADNVGFGWPS
jgi:glycosyltransferase involved in cell wall biosynthesis